MTTAELTKEQLALISEWQRSKNTLELAKSCERQLRDKVISIFFPYLPEGTQTVSGSGYTIKAEGKLTRTLDEAALEAVMPQLPENYRVLGQPDSLISYKPAFSMKAYRAMDENSRKIFEQALTIKDAAPSLEVVLRK